MRSFRSKPVGWRGESYRHYLASKGVSSQRYLAYRGASAYEREVIERLLNRNPRLRFVRDRAVKDIVVKGSAPEKLEGASGAFRFAVGEGKPGDIELYNTRVERPILGGSVKDYSQVKLLDEAEMKDILEHELSHAAHHMVIDPAEEDRLHGEAYGAAIIGDIPPKFLGDRPKVHFVSNIFADPSERLTYRRGALARDTYLESLDNLNRSKQSKMNMRLLGDIEDEYVKGLRGGKRFRDLPVVWSDEYMARKVLKKGKVHVTRSGDEVRALASEVAQEVRPYASRVAVAGSVRREVAAPVDVDLVVVPRAGQAAVIRDRLRRESSRVYADGPQKFSGRIRGVKTEVSFSRPEEFGAQLMTATGPAGANIYHRSQARARGWLLNQHGLFDARGRRLAGSEREIYKRLGLSYRDPRLRGSPRQ